jgi:hypothetical protein
MCLRGDQAARKLTPQIEAYVRARWPDLSRAGTYGIGKRLRQESSRSSQWSFARKRCVPLLGELKLQAVPATRARLEESESVPTTTADGLPHSGQNLPGNQRVSSESEETDCDCWPQDAGQPPGPSTSAGSNSKKDPSGVNEAGCYSGLRKPFPKELNLRLIFTLRPDFSEVWIRSHPVANSPKRGRVAQFGPYAAIYVGTGD